MSSRAAVRRQVAWLFASNPRGARHSARSSRRNIVFGGPTWEPDHEAFIRFGGRAPKGGPHSDERFNDHVQARVTATSDRERPTGRKRSPAGRAETLCLRSLSVRLVRSGRLPQHNAVRDFACGDPCARALSFWNSKKRKANWIRPRRTRALPDLVRPFSRRFHPLSSGAPVSPT
jgi:hypothetical protein